MATYRWNPMREIADMQRAMDRMFDDAWRTNAPTSGSTLAFDVYETDADYRVITALPGLSIDQINITLHDGVLTISGEIPHPELEEGTRALIQERFYGKFSRSMRLPQEVNVDNVEAAYENGMLVLHLPKLPEAQPRKIPVKSAKLLESQN